MDVFFEWTASGGQIVYTCAPLSLRLELRACTCIDTTSLDEVFPVAICVIIRSPNMSQLENSCAYKFLFKGYGLGYGLVWTRKNAGSYRNLVISVFVTKPANYLCSG